MTVGDLDTSSEPSEPPGDAADPPAPSTEEEPVREQVHTVAAPPEEAPAVVLDALAELRERLDALVADGRSATARAEARERVVVHQREELDTLRAERRGGHLRPVVVGLAKLRAELLAEAGRDPVDGRDAGVFTYFAEGVLSVMETCGCERVPLVPGDPFDPAAHTVVRTVDSEPDAHRRVVEVLAEGWVEHDSGRVLAPAKVVVGRHRPTETQREEPTDD